MLRRLAVAASLVVLGACESSAPPVNRFDPNSSAEKAPGRISGTVFIEGAASQAGFVVHVRDQAGAEVAPGLVTAAEGVFTSPELAAASYRVSVEVPVGSMPIRVDEVAVLPGRTTEVGLLTSRLAPAVGRIFGHVVLEHPNESPSGVTVVLTRTSGVVLETRVTVTDSAGDYSLSELPAGAYEIRADRVGFTPDLVDVELPDLNAATRQAGCEGAACEARELKLYPASAIVRFSVRTDTGAVDGAPFTRQRDVDLLMQAFGGVNEMRFSESPAFADAPEWRDYIASAPVTLSEGEGQKTAYAQFRVMTEDGRERLRTETYQTSIVYDATPPVILSFVVAPNAVERGGVRYLTEDPTSVPVEVVAFDPYSHVAGVKLVVEDADPATLPFAVVDTSNASTRFYDLVALSPADGPKEVGLVLRDGAGNESAVTRRELFIDTTPPLLVGDPAVVVRGADGLELRSTLVTLQFLVGADPARGVDGPVRMRYGEAPIPPSGVTLGFLPEISLLTAHGHGDVVQFYGVFEDNAGNAVEVLSPSYRMNLRGTLSGKVFLEGYPEDALEHGGTLVAVYPAGADVAIAPPTVSAQTTPDGSYLVAGVAAGSYQVVLSRQGAIPVVRSPVAIVAGEVTDLGTERLALARGGLEGVFQYADIGVGGSHAGISVSAVLEGKVLGTAQSDDAGLVTLSGLAVADGYQVKVSAAGYVAATLLGERVVRDVTTAMNGGAPLVLAKLAGDFKICSQSDAASPPKDCAAILYTDQAQVLLGLDAENVTHVRYVLEDPTRPGKLSFASPDATPASDLCAASSAEQCWNAFNPAERYLVAVSARERRATVLVQFANNADVRPVSSAQVVYDATAPLSPSLVIARGAAAVLDGYTNSPELIVTATALATSGAPEDAAPLATVRLSRDGAWDGDGTSGDRQYSYGGNKVFAASSVEGEKSVSAWFCDAAGNCSAAATTATIILDSSPPTRLNGRTVAPSGAGVTLESLAQRRWWTRSTRYGLELGLGASLWPVAEPDPEVAAYRVALTQNFVGAAWVPVDVAVFGAGDTLVAEGADLPPIDGEHVVYAQFKDAAGNVSTAEVDGDKATLLLDTVPPGGSVSIEGGAAYTRKTGSLAVALATDLSNGAVEIQTSWSGILPDPYVGARAPFATPLEVTPPSGDGHKTLYVRFFDAAGNFAERQSGIFVDTTPPDPSALARCDSCRRDTSGKAYYSDVNGQVTLFLFATDNSGLIKHVEVTVDGDALSKRIIQYAPYATVTLSTVEGPHTVQVSFVDPAGNVRALASFTAEHDRTPPSLTLVQLNAGAAWTANPSVSLAVTADDEGDTARLAGVYISNSPTFGDAALQPLTSPATFTWTLEAASGDGNKVVYVKVLDWAGNAASLQDDIRLDRAPPSLAAALVGPVANGTSTTLTRSASVNVSMTASDLGTTDAAELSMQLSSSADFAGATWAPFTTPQSFTLPSPAVDGLKTVHVRVRDLAGNERQVSAATVLDATAPTLSAATLVAGASTAYAPGSAATLQLASFGADEIRVTGDLADAFAGSWMPAVAALAVTLSDGDGQKTITVEVRDLAGNLSSPASRSASIVRDGSGPAGASVVIDGGAGFTDSRAVWLTLAAADAGSGVPSVALANGSIACASATYEPFAQGFAWTLPQGDGAQQVWACFKDGAGNTTAVSGSVILDETAPSGLSVIIAGGAAFTTSADVAVTLAASDNLSAQGALLVQLAQDPAFTGATWSTFTASRSLSLQGGDGQKSVYLRVRDEAGNIAVASGSIVLDSENPSGQSLALSPSTYATSADVVASLGAAGATQLCLWGDVVSDPGDACAAGSSGWRSYVATLPLTLTSGDGDKAVSVKYRDAAGLESAAATASLVLDSAAPDSASVQVNAGATRTSSVAVTLSIAASDVTSGVVEMAVANESLACAAATYEPFATLKAWSLLPSDGARTVLVCVRDRAGHTRQASVVVELDRQAPTELSALIAGGAYTTSASVTVALAATGASEVCLTGDLAAAPDCLTSGFSALTASTSVTLSSGDGSKRVVARFRDEAGNVAEASDSIVLDTQAPYAPSLALSPAAYARTTSVVASLGATGASQMCLWGDFVGGATDACVAASSSWEAFLPGKALTLSAGDGAKTVNVKYRDAAWLTSSPASASVTLDGSAPATGSVLVNGADAHSATTNVTLTLAASDVMSGVVELAVANESITCTSADYEPFVTSKAWTLAASEGLRTVAVCFKDRAGNTLEVSDTITLDRAPPTATSVLIAVGETYVSSAAVTVALAATDATEMCLAGDLVSPPDCVTSGWEAYAPSKALTLSLGDGSKVVVASFRDAAGNLARASDSVVLDTLAPYAPSLILSPAIYAPSTAVVATLGATGATELCLWGDIVGGATDSCAPESTSWEAVLPSKALTLASSDGAKSVNVLYRDGAGWLSSVVTASVTLDTAIPSSGAVVIDAGAETSRDLEVTLTFAATDLTSGVVELAVANESISCASANYEPYVTSKAWTLSSSEGERTVAVCFRDRAGHAREVSDAITVDRVAPSALSVSVAGGLAYATSPSVTVSVGASDAAEMCVGGDLASPPDCVTSGWETYGTSKAVTLAQGDGAKSVVVSFRDAAGNVAQASDGVILDTQAPYAPMLTLSPATYAPTAGVTATLGATGATQYCLYGNLVGGSTDSCAASGWADLVQTLALTLDAGDGAKTVNAKYRDAAGWISSVATASVTRDGTAPATGTLVINGGAAFTSTTNVTLSLAATDATSGVVEMALANESITCASATYEPYTTLRSWVLSASEGVRTVAACFKDRAGNTRQAQGTIELDRTAPSGLAVSIAAGAGYATSASVTVSIAATSATQMCVAGDLVGAPDCIGSGWEAYGNSKAVTLSSPDGQKSVSVRFRDAAGNVSQASDTITLDTAAPTGAVVINANAEYATQTGVTLTMTASGDVTQMRVANGVSCASGVLEGFQTTKSWTLTTTQGAQSVSVCFYDAAGSSGAAADSITLDSVLPAGTLSINAAAAFTTSRDVTLGLASTADAIGVAIADGSSLDCATTSYSPMQASRAWLLPVGDGTPAVVACFRDRAGNTASATDTILLDTTPPGTPGLTSSGLSDRYVTVQWTTPADLDLAGFTLERRLDNEGTYTLIAPSLAKTTSSYSDVIPAAELGRARIFRVRAFDTHGLYSSYSIELNAGVATTRSRVVYMNPYDPTHRALAWDKPAGTVLLLGSYRYADGGGVVYEEAIPTNAVFTRLPMGRERFDESVTLLGQNADATLTWQTQYTFGNVRKVIDADVGWNWFDARVAVGPDGTAHLVWGSEIGTSHIMYQKLDGQSAPVTVLASGADRYTGVAVGTDGVARVIYTSSSGMYFRVMDGVSSARLVSGGGSVQSPHLALDGNNDGHICARGLAGWDLFYAKVAATITTETADAATADTGRACSIAVDKNNVPHIAYSDYTNRDLRYLKKDGVSVPQTLDSLGDVGSDTAIDIDPTNEQPVIAYLDITNARTKVLRVGGATSIVDAGYASDLAVSIDDGGVPHVSYTTPAALYHLALDGTDTPQVVQSRGAPGQNGNMVVDGLGRVHFLYRNADTNSVDYARLESAGVVRRLAGPGVYGIDVALDSSKLATLTYVQDGTSLRTVRAARRPTTTVIKDAGTWLGSPALAIDSSNMVHLAFYEYTNRNLEYFKTGSGVTVLDATGDVGQMPALAVTSGGVAHITYTDVTNTALKYVSTATNIPQILDDHAQIDLYAYSAIALGSDGTPRVAYTRAAGLEREFWYRPIDGVTAPVYAMNGGYSVAMALNAQNQPVIVSQSVAGDGPQLVIDPPTGTPQKLESSVRGTGDYPQVRIDAMGVPHVVYRAGDFDYALGYLRADGLSRPQRLFTEGYVASVIGSVGGLDQIKMAYDPAGVTHLAFIYLDGDDSGHLFYAKGNYVQRLQPNQVNAMRLPTTCSDVEVFGPDMVGCAGKFTFAQRTSICSEAGLSVCSAAQWVARRRANAPAYNYWSADPLRWNGGDGSCFVSASVGSACNASDSMAVCAAKTDVLGNSCVWTGCGLTTTLPNEYFGGCASSAGVLCCTP